MLAVSKPHVRMAKDVLHHGDAETIADVDAGRVKVGAAQRRIMAKPKPPPAPPAAKPTLAEEISAFIRELRARGVGKLPMAQRVALAEAFGRALGVGSDSPDNCVKPRPQGDVGAVSHGDDGNAADPVADFLARGGAITRCPSTVNPTAEDRAALQAHHAERDAPRQARSNRWVKLKAHAASAV
jgi:hypothetical protein